LKRVPAVFYRTEAGREPVREWLRAMDQEDRRQIGEDLKAVELGWPLGMPLCRSLGDGLHEARTSLSAGRIVRVFFYIDRHQRMVLLHGILKRTQKTPPRDLELARANMRRHRKSLK
jgi:phage-related protein